MFSALSYKYSLLYTYTFVDHVSTTTRLVPFTEPTLLTCTVHWPGLHNWCCLWSRSSWLVFCMTRTVHGSDLHTSLLYSQVTNTCDIQLYFCRYPQSHVEIFIWWLVPLMEQFMYRVVNNQYLPSYFPFLTLCVSVRMPDEFIIFDDIFPLVTLWLRTEMGIWREG
jgi:hypothetical protein